MANLLENLHPATIHFPLAGIVVAFICGLIALLLGIFLDFNSKLIKEKKKIILSSDASERLWRFIDRFEFSSWIGVVLAEFGLIVAGISGLYDSKGIDNAVNNPYLAFKVQLTIYLFFILLVPFMLKLYVGIVHHKSLFGTEKGGNPPNPYPLSYRIPPLLYLFTLSISAFLSILIAGAGGRFVYGHSLLDVLGLGSLFT